VLPPPPYSTMFEYMCKLILAKGTPRVQWIVVRCGSYCIRRYSERCRRQQVRIFLPR
jgi:hypothetical protein